MNWFGQKKWMIGCIVLAIVLLVLTVNSVALYKQNDRLKEEYVRNLNAEWYQLYRLSDIVDNSYIKNNFQNPKRYELFVNQIAYNFTGRPDDLSGNMRNLLVLAYDPLFKNLSLEEGALNKEEASKLLKDMNDDIMLISTGITFLPVDEIGKILLDSTSSEYIKVNTQVKTAYDKYIKLVHDYFKNNQN